MLNALRILCRDSRSVLWLSLTHGWNAGATNLDEKFRRIGKRHANAECIYVRANDAHPAFRDNDAARERASRRSTSRDQLSGSFIGRIINRFYDKRRSDEIYCVYAPGANASTKLSRGDSSSVMPRECCLVNRAYENLLQARENSLMLNIDRRD